MRSRPGLSTWPLRVRCERYSAGGHEARSPRRVRVDRLVSLPGRRAEEKRLSERQGDFLAKAGVGLRRIRAFRVPVDGNLEFSPETGEIVGVIQTSDLDFTDGKAPLLHERPQLRFPLAGLRLVREIESLLGPVIPADGEGGAEPELVEPEVVKEPLVVPEERRGVSRLLRRQVDVLDVDDPQPVAREVIEHPERRVPERRETERELADALLSVKDLRVVDDPVPAEEEEVLPVLELVDSGGERVEQGARRDRVLEEAGPAPAAASPGRAPSG